MYKYFITVSVTAKEGSSYRNLYYDIDYKLNNIENIEKIIKDLKMQCDSESLSIIFFTELKED